MNGSSAKIFDAPVGIALTALLQSLDHALGCKCFQRCGSHTRALAKLTCRHRQVALQEGSERLLLGIGGQLDLSYLFPINEGIGIGRWDRHAPDALGLFPFGFLQNAPLFGNAKGAKMLELEFDTRAKATAQSI